MVERKIIPMIYDEVFKSVLQDKESEGYLVDIINNVTGIKKDYMKGNIVFKNVELPKNSVREKGKATDLIVEIKENIINLEMNKNYYEGLYDKNDRPTIRFNRFRTILFRGNFKASLRSTI